MSGHDHTQPPTQANPPTPSGQSNNPMGAFLTNAFSYIEQVKVEFVDRPEKYSQFLDIVKEYRELHTQDPTTLTCIYRVVVLFHGHPQLILGYNAFLPCGYSLELEDENTVIINAPGPAA
ncbi:paired amphipathic helix protein Sin3b [Apiospora kogelbergensis]|uniref:Paired amphipathic helix protein Sin3b n=1 Tax=Apiospora kogelbergensis TaxID=1337665 RepID=A0AAW0QQK6_9PEZI